MTAKIDTTKEQIFSKGCLVILNISQYSGRMSVDKKIVKEKMGSDKVRAMKRTLPEKALKDIQNHCSSARIWLNTLSLPFPINSAVFATYDNVELIDNELNKRQKEFYAMVDVLAEKYNEFKEEGMAALEEAGLANEKDYPRDIKSKFSFTWRFVTIDAPGGNNVVSPEFIKREQKRFQDTMEEARQMAVMAIRQQFYEIVQHAVERLAVDEDGKKKIFKQPTLDKFQAFFDTFSNKNIFGDQELEDIINKSKMIMAGVDAEDIRSDDDFRGMISDSLKEVKAEMDSGVMKAGRKLNLK